GPVGLYLAYPLVWLLGWPAALLTPLVPTVHALRLFGRLESETDRQWMVFMAGLVVLLPVAVGLALGVRIGDDQSAAAGMWGLFIAAYSHQFLGTFGAWVGVLLGACVLT